MNSTTTNLSYLHGMATLLDSIERNLIQTERRKLHVLLVERLGVWDASEIMRIRQARYDHQQMMKLDGWEGCCHYHNRLSRPEECVHEHRQRVDEEGDPKAIMRFNSCETLVQEDYRQDNVDGSPGPSHHKSADLHERLEDTGSYQHQYTSRAVQEKRSTAHILIDNAGEQRMLKDGLRYRLGMYDWMWENHGKDAAEEWAKGYDHYLEPVQEWWEHEDEPVPEGLDEEDEPVPEWLDDADVEFDLKHCAFLSQRLRRHLSQGRDEYDEHDERDEHDKHDEHDSGNEKLPVTAHESAHCSGTVDLPGLGEHRSAVTWDIHFRRIGWL